MIDTKNNNKINNTFQKFQKLSISPSPKFQKLDNWLEKEANIFLKEKKQTTYKYPKFKRGQIIKADFGINIGTELSNTHFAIILNKDDTTKNDNVTVLPISSNKGYKRIPLGKILKKALPNTNHYNQNCYAIIPQITTISKKRIFKINTNYTCNNNTLNKVDQNIINYLTHKK